MTISFEGLDAVRATMVRGYFIDATGLL